MKWRVIIRPRAEADLGEARNWYENQRAGLGDEFLTEIGITIQLLSRDQTAGQITIVAFAGC